MNAQPQIIRQSDLLNRLVLDRSTAEEVGRVEQLWLNSQSHQVVGFSCKSGFLGSLKQVFRWEQITTIGTDSIIVNNTPEVIEPETPIQKISLIGHEVWTDAGNKAGKIIDYLFNPKTGAVVNYLFVSSGWRGVLNGVYLLPVEAISSTGSKRALVADAIVQTPQQYTQGLNQKMSQAAELLREDYKKTQDDLEALKRSAQNIAEQVKDTTETVTGIAKDKFSEATQRQDTSQPNETIKTIDTTAQSLPNEPPELPGNTN
ncbi:PRC-barrel domain-containing protein [Coleofasciculus sp. FACHB-542]|uniref:PRC-barrel domain-containing protein n=1 Tax=Coleofasciculus sp. FACHB-542 TaxID=2692787 RepID=UPI0016866515|nr:PRC-barrel domain-containing protein [Coleofasciculus sp. FACHB-542]MBD2084665.1 PRC-barrel domain-containing protein [Coleofasciculus sp. FACHB-542]